MKLIEKIEEKQSLVIFLIDFHNKKAKGDYSLTS